MTALPTTQKQELQPTPALPERETPTYQSLQADMPTQKDFLDEAKKISDMRLQAAEDKLKFNTRNLGEDVSRSLYSQNVGATSGVGQELATRAIDRQLQQYRPEVMNIQADLASQQLGYNDKRETSFRNEILDAGRANRQEDEKIRTEGRLQASKISDEQRSLANTYGINPETQQPFTSVAEGERYVANQKVADKLVQNYGQNMDGETPVPFTSENEALMYWADKGFDQKVLQKWGINKESGQPFTSENEATEYWTQKGFDADLLRKFGVDGDSKPFTSEQQAIDYYKAEGFSTKLLQDFGLNPVTQQPYTSLLEAEADWEDRGYNKEIGRKYGMNPVTELPWENEKQAVEYWKGQGFDADLLREYGLDPKTKKPFASKALADQYFNEQPQRVKELFDMALAGDLKGEPLDAILLEYGLTTEDVEIEDVETSIIQNYMDAKIGANQPVNMEELKSILGVLKLKTGEELTDEALIYSPSFAQSILSTDDGDLEKYLEKLGFEPETVAEGGFLGIGTDYSWRMKKNEKNMKLFKEKYTNDAEFRDYVNGFIN